MVVSLLPETKRLVATQALDHLFSQGWFSICNIDSVMKVIGNSHQGDAYKQLRALHCVHYDKMRPELVAILPQLVNEALRDGQAHCVATDTALDGVVVH